MAKRADAPGRHSAAVRCAVRQERAHCWPQRPATAPEGRLIDATNATLLLVDDDANNRDVLSRRLQRRGYTVLTAENGPAALEMVGAHRVDAVLLDVMMPGMSGIETLKRLRQSRSVAELPVIRP
jgi:response regulator RpfG family c-di-GMP phosphodiesterase